MALFKKKVEVAKYCSGKLDGLFTREREAAWDTLRAQSNDAHLKQADSNLYYSNLRAVMVTLVHIAVVKNCNMESSVSAKAFISDYLNGRSFTEIDSLSREYSAAFSSSYADGIVPMVQLFAEKVTQSKIGEPARQQFYTDFYGLLGALFEEFKTIKLGT